MTRYVIGYGSERFDLDAAEGAEFEAFAPPAGMSPAHAEAALREVLERPRGYPPLRDNVVPGDRVAIALDPDVPDPSRVLDVVTDILEGAGVEADAVTIVEAARHAGALVSGSRGEVTEVHDPGDRERLAYLATTKAGSRVYLNRTLTDADVVVPVGFLREDPLAGPHGPWSVLFPGLSDEATRAAHRKSRASGPHEASRKDADDEAFEVGWLLGSRFQIGIVPGEGGPSGFVAGLDEQVRDAGLAELSRAWSFRPEARADLVIAGVGGPEGPGGLNDLVAALVTAGRLVRHGGRIVALSQVGGPLGPAMQRLAGAGDSNPRDALRGHEADPDHLMAEALARVLGWADVYLLSGLAPDVVEDLSMIALERPEEVRRLASRASSCLVVGHADRVRGEVREGELG